MGGARPFIALKSDAIDSADKVKQDCTHLIHLSPGNGTGGRMRRAGGIKVVVMLPGLGKDAWESIADRVFAAIASGNFTLTASRGQDLWNQGTNLHYYGSHTYTSNNTRRHNCPVSPQTNTVHATKRRCTRRRDHTSH